MIQPQQLFDADGRARAVAEDVGSLTRAKDGGMKAENALELVAWAE